MTRDRMTAPAVALGVLTFAYRYLSFDEFSNDHFVHLAEAQQMVLGAMPVRDFVERGIPLMAGLSATGQLVLGEGLRSELIHCRRFVTEPDAAPLLTRVAAKAAPRAG